MYIKPALPCLPFFVVSSINLLSRPELGPEGNAAVKGGAESNCLTVNKKNFKKIYITFTLKRLFRECFKLGVFRMCDQNFSGRGDVALEEARSQTGWRAPSTPSPAQLARPLWPLLQVPALIHKP